MKKILSISILFLLCHLVYCQTKVGTMYRGSTTTKVVNSTGILYTGPVQIEEQFLISDYFPGSMLTANWLFKEYPRKKLALSYKAGFLNHRFNPDKILIIESEIRKYDQPMSLNFLNLGLGIDKGIGDNIFSGISASGGFSICAKNYELFNTSDTANIYRPCLVQTDDKIEQTYCLSEGFEVYPMFNSFSTFFIGYKFNLSKATKPPIGHYYPRQDKKIFIKLSVNHLYYRWKRINYHKFPIGIGAGFEM